MGALKDELRPHLVVPVDDSSAGRRDQLVYAPREFLRITPYTSSNLNRVLYILLVICTGGILGIVSVWFPQIKTRLARKRLPFSSLGDAEYMLVLVHEDGWRSTYIETPVHRVVHTDKTHNTKHPWVWFECKKHRYVFNHSKGEFERYLATVTEDLAKMRARLNAGLNVDQAMQKEELFGTNVVDIEPPLVGTLLFTKSVHPYYLFQVFSATVWFCQDYTLFATVIATLSVCSLAWEIYSEISNSNRLRALVRSDRDAHVLRDGVVAKLHESALVPGDIVELSKGQVVADMLLLSGGCVVDEAALTGEAVPINKEAARGHTVVVTDTSARLQFKSSFLHAGSTITRVREASGPCKGVVLSTGFSTGKGELFRSIIFPREITFEFERDAYRFLAVLATIAVFAFTKRMVDFDADAHSLGYMLSNSLALVTIAVPPALPIVLSSGIGIALARLKEKGIFCIDARRINSCGQLDTFCFDKTGTLTEESLQLVGVDVIAHHKAFERVTLDTIPRMMRLAMATCHSLSEADGQLQGYSLELSMFDKAQVALEFVHDHVRAQEYLAIASLSHGEKFGVVKRFPFDPTCQRSSVIVENLETKQRFVFVKGSLEAIRAIAVDTPADFEQKSLRYGADGHYCIGFGVRALGAEENINMDTREAVEASVDFMGIALFHNELKPESKAMIQELYAAAIDVRMITGDNALTAVHVARLLDMELKSNIAVVDVDASHEVVYHGIEELRSAEQIQWEPLTSANIDHVLAEYDVALTGAALEQLSMSLTDESFKLLLLETRIFARIRPMQKSWIVERLMDYGRTVGMCGDGTNDCGALKAAHVGLALSSAEASIVAPFTSKAKAVTDVPVLIREGRCALTTSFLGFKFMVLYPVIQLGMASTLGHWGCKLSNNQYIWDDMGIVLGMALTMVYTRSSKTLSKERPPKSLFSLTVVASILGQCVLFIVFFAVVLVMMYDQSWFCKRADGMAYVDLYRNDPASVFSADFSQQVLTNCQFYEKYTTSLTGSSEQIPVGHEIAVTWLFAHMQYFSVAAAFNLKDKFRRPFYTNFWFTSYFVVSLAANLWFLLDDSGTIDELFQSLPLTKDFRLTMVWVFGLHFVSALAWEMLATWYLPQWRRKRAEAKKETMAYPEYVTNQQLPVNSNKAKEEALLTGIQVSRR